MTHSILKPPFAFSGKKLIFIALGIFFSLLFCACEDDPILDASSDEDCVGSYCLLVKPSDTNHSIEFEVNPEEF